MTMNLIKKISIIVIVVVYVIGVKSAPRSKSVSYDQKQTGDYNIRLHLKDFQIIALLSDYPFGELGEYDYEYDESLLTEKPQKPDYTNVPVHFTTTKKPSKPGNRPERPVTSKPHHKPSASSTEKPFTSENNPLENKPEIIKPIPENIAAIISNPKPETTETPVVEAADDYNPSPKPDNILLSKPIVEKLNLTVNNQTTKLDSDNTTSNKPIVEEATLKPSKPNQQLNQIPVIVLMPTVTQYPHKTVKNSNEKQNTSNQTITQKVEATTEINKKEQSTNVIPITNSTDTSMLSILPAKKKPAITLRRCGEGFKRDHTGRCRRVRKPSGSQIPLGVKLANIASRLRIAPTSLTSEIPSS